MKKIIGLIMIAGISYGAQIVTPPGIQVNGLATNNNVMVYSDGMLLDSGVAPTNLVSVTNLTADIEALSATNAAQDALIAGNLYDTGTTNKTLIDAAIASGNSIGTYTNTISYMLIGQSNAEGFPVTTNWLSSELISGAGYGWISETNRFTTTGSYYGRDSALSYTNLGYLAGGEISWGVELPLGELLYESGGFTSVVYKATVGGAPASSFYNGGTYWGLVTNSYEQASTKIVPSFVIYMRGETGSTSQTQAESYSERTNVYYSLVNYFGNNDLKFIQCGLPSGYYENSNGPDVEAGAKQFANENANVYYIETHDIDAASHYNEAQIYEVANRISSVALNLFGGTVRDSIGADSISARGDLRGDELYRKGRTLDQSMADFIGDDATETKAALSEYLKVPRPLYTNDAIVVARLDTDLSNGVSGVTFDNENCTLNGGFDYRFGDSVTITNDSPQTGFWTDDLSISNSNFSAAYWYRREYVPNTGDTAFGYSMYVFNTAGSGAGISLVHRQYVTPITSANNYRPSINIMDASGTIVTGNRGLIEPELNEWNHYVWVVERNSTNSVFKLYANGVLDSTFSPTNDFSVSPIHATYPVGIGARRYGTTSNLACDGSIGEFMLFYRAINADEVWSIYGGQTFREIE